MRPNGDDLRRLTRDGAAGQNNWPVWSPDGNQIVWNRGEVLWIMVADGSDKRLLTRRGGAPAAWAPGPRVAFQCRTKRDVNGLCAIDPRTHEITELLGGIDAGFPGWRPRTADR